MPGRLILVLMVVSACGDDSGGATDGPVSDMTWDLVGDRPPSDTTSEGRLDYPFMCGTLMCDTIDEYCSETIPGVPGGMNVYSCEDLTGACTQANATCACFTLTPECDCAVDAQGAAFSVTCAAP